jgi:hypothetical protein
MNNVGPLLRNPTTKVARWSAHGALAQLAVTELGIDAVAPLPPLTRIQSSQRHGQPIRQGEEDGVSPKVRGSGEVVTCSFVRRAPSQRQLSDGDTRLHRDPAV